MSGLGAAAYRLAKQSGLAAFSRRAWPGATVLCYHNVVPDALEGRVGDGPLHLGARRFAAHLDWISSAFRVVPLSDIVGRVRRGETLGGLAALTFDDAYQGVLDHALPLLRTRGIPATVFVVSEASRQPQPFWWDRLGGMGSLDEGRRADCLYRLGGGEAAIAEEFPGQSPAHERPATLPASFEALRAALGSGINAGSHTRTHPNLTTLAAPELAQELAGSRTDLGERLGAAPELISYPYGCVNQAVREAAARAGYAGGIALSYGRVRPGSDPFGVIRVNVPASLPVDTLACWASGLRWNRPR